MHSIRARLQGVIVTLVLGALLTCGLAFMIADEGKKGLTTVYSDRVLPLEQLKGVSDAYAVSIVDNTHKVRSGAITFEDGVSNMDKALRESDRLFSAYLATWMDPNEKRLAKLAQDQIRSAQPSVSRLRGILVQHDQAALEKYATSELYPTVDPVTAALDKLVKIQVSEAKKSFDSASSAEEHLLWALVVALVVNLLLAAAGVWIVRRQVIAPINRLTGVMTRLADGDYEVDVPGREARNEIGEMACAVEVFKDNGIERLRLEAAENRAIAARETRTRKVEDLVRQFDSNTSEVVQVVSVAATELEASAQTLTSGAEETTRQSTTISAASEQASMSVQTVAAATEEMTATIQEIARQVQGSVVIAKDGVAQAHRSAEIMHKLSEGASRIGDFVNLITQVASQTNLLALNATIEAARAGAAGNGFAVVASEVKTLAQQTAKASADIEAQVHSIQRVVDEAVGAIETTRRMIEQMSEATTAISAAVEEQHATTQEIARNVQEASVGTTEVASNMASISRATEETSAAAVQVLSASGELAQQADRIQKFVADFITGIRAA